MRTCYSILLVATTTMACLVRTGTSFLVTSTTTPLTTPNKQSSSSLDAILDRRNWLSDIASTCSAAMVATTTNLGGWVEPAYAAADGGEASMIAADVAAKTEMKDFVDPLGLFTIRVPKTFFTLRRTVKGDLPDDKTGKGRRGSSIFTAGNMAKAEVIAVERYPIQSLLEDNGYEATGDLSTFTAIGQATAVANLIILRREKDSQNQAAKVLESVKVSPDGKELSFKLTTEIEVQKPELLLEQYGVSKLFRITVAKATLNSNDGNIMAVFASALEQDFNNGVDGPALQESVDSFVATAQS